MPESAYPSYEERCRHFDWSISELELGYHKGDHLNIGWMCSDRICGLGLADKPALIWEGHQGDEKRFTYNDVRILSNTVAHFLGSLESNRASGSACSWIECRNCTSGSWAS